MKLLNTLILVLALLVIIYLILNDSKLRESFTINYSKTNEWSIGPYSDLILKTEKNNNKLLDPNQFKLYQGDGIPLKDNKNNINIDNRDMLDHYDYPSVDGDPNSLKSNFMFAYNKSSPDCCPSSYTTSGGCVCITQKQKDLISNRGTKYNK